MPKVSTTGGLVGGSAGEVESRGGHPFFYDGVKVVKLFVKNVYGLRILPAFDSRFPVDSAEFKRSFVPYRLETTGTEKPEFSGWYFTLRGYEFVGNDARHFLSPLCKITGSSKGVCPMYDTFLTARNHTNPDWKALSEKPKTRVNNQYNAILPGPRSYGVFNALLNVNEKLENRLIMTSDKCMELLREDLNCRAGRNDPTITTAFSDFLLGDVTDPATGLWGTAQKTSFGDAGMETVAIQFSKSRDRLINHQGYPIDVNSAFGIATLEGRYRIDDLVNTTHILSAEEILEFMVSDGFLPYELIKEACSRHWQVPTAHPNVKYFNPAEPDDVPYGTPGGGGNFGAPPPQGGVAAPQTPPAASVPQTPPSAPPSIPAAPGQAPGRAPAPNPGMGGPPPAIRSAAPPAPVGGAGAPPPAIRTMAPQPSAPPPPVAAPVAPAPTPPPAPVEPPAQALSAEEEAWLTAFQNNWAAATAANSITGEQMQYYTGLMDRKSRIEAAKPA